MSNESSKESESERTLRYRCDVGVPLDRRLTKARLDEARLLDPLELVALLDEVDRRDGRAGRLREGAERLRTGRKGQRRTFSLEEGRGRTRRISARRVPRPGPSSTTRTRLGEPCASHCVTYQMARSCVRRSGGQVVRSFQSLGRLSSTTCETELEGRTRRTSPNTCEISGLVTKSPSLPNTVRVV